MLLLMVVARKARNGLVVQVSKARRLRWRAFEFSRAETEQVADVHLNFEPYGRPLVFGD